MAGIGGKLRKLGGLFSRRQRNFRWYRRLWASAPLDDASVLLEQQRGLTSNGSLFHVARALSSGNEYSGMHIAFVADVAHIGRIRGQLAERGLSCEVVERRSARYYELLACAGFVVCDTSMPPEFAKRPGQMLVNTWHGTPLKTLGRRIPGDEGRIGNVQKCFMAADLVLAPNEFTAQVLARDYMFAGFGTGSLLLGAYPRNGALLAGTAAERAGETTKGRVSDGGRVYAYLPTFRSGTGAGAEADAGEAAARLAELDALLRDDEVLYAQLHPVVGEALDFSGLRHVRPFPPDVEAYDFLARCDALLTDYSSVMFDFAATGRKVVLFAYDEERYLADRGTYLDLGELPFPRVHDAVGAVRELREPRAYDDAAFLERFCPYDAPDAAAAFCRRVFLGESLGEGREVPIERLGSGRPRALVYVGGIMKPKGGSAAAGENAAAVAANVERSGAAAGDWQSAIAGCQAGPPGRAGIAGVADVASAANAVSAASAAGAASATGVASLGRGLAIAGIAGLLDSHDVLVAFPAKLVEQDPDFILDLPRGVSFLPVAGGPARLLRERVADKLGATGLAGVGAYERLTRGYRDCELARELCGMTFDLLVCVPGMDWRSALLASGANAKRKALVVDDATVSSWPRCASRAKEAYDVIGASFPKR